MAEPAKLVTTAIVTTAALIEQFTSSLSPDTQHSLPPTATDAPSPLLLLSAAAKSLKAQVTKLSLLTITAPFTPGAVSTCLQSINDSVLPSLVTATLLATEELYSKAFANECKSLTRGALRDLQVLVKSVEARNKDGKPKTELAETKKQEITEATGRVWEDCDTIAKLAEGGLLDFTVRKAKQWLDLMKDAVRELQEWDPDEDVGDDDIFGDTVSDDGHPQEVSTNGAVDTEGSDNRATISAGVKDQALRVLSRIPQSVHVVVKQRLEKIRKDAPENLAPDVRSRLDQTLTRTRNVSELIDESAEGMYLGDLELCLKKAGEARAITIEIVESALEPFDPSSSRTGHREETQEDKYVKRALDWIRQVDTVKDLPKR